MENNRFLKLAVGILTLIVVIETAALVGSWRAKIKKPVRPAAALGKIALVLDDWGYSLNNVELLRQVRVPLTLSVLPALSFSGRIVQEARGPARELILHLPMEPHEKGGLEKNTILTSMSETEIAAIVAEDLAPLSGVRGVNNHMGSRATEDVRVMTVVFKELKKRNMYFLDSYVTPRSVCKDLARQMHLEFARRDVFIDNQSDPVSIRQQLLKLKARALTYGFAIGIGHDRPHTLAVLAQMVPQFEQEGIQFVFVSDLVR